MKGKVICIIHDIRKSVDYWRYIAAQKCQLYEVLSNWEGHWCRYYDYSLTKIRNLRNERNLIQTNSSNIIILIAGSSVATDKVKNNVN